MNLPPLVYVHRIMTTPPSCYMPALMESWCLLSWLVIICPLVFPILDLFYFRQPLACCSVSCVWVLDKLFIYGIVEIDDELDVSGVFLNLKENNNNYVGKGWTWQTFTQYQVESKNNVVKTYIKWLLYKALEQENEEIVSNEQVIAALWLPNYDSTSSSGPL